MIDKISYFNNWIKWCVYVNFDFLFEDFVLFEIYMFDIKLFMKFKL